MDYDELMAMYRDSLREKRALAARLWARLRSGEGGHADVAALKACLHQVAGSAGAYGFGLLGENARTLERALVLWLGAADAERPPASTLGRRHVGDYEEFEHAIARAIDRERA